MFDGEKVSTEFRERHIDFNTNINLTHYTIVGQLENTLSEQDSDMRTGNKCLKRNVHVGWYVC